MLLYFFSIYIFLYRKGINFDYRSKTPNSIILLGWEMVITLRNDKSTDFKPLPKPQTLGSRKHLFMVRKF
jgi:hypothetical protein